MYLPGDLIPIVLCELNCLMMVIGVQLHRADSLIIYIQHTETAVDTWRLVLFLRVCFCVFECVFRFQVCIHICLG